MASLPLQRLEPEAQNLNCQKKNHLAEREKNQTMLTRHRCAGKVLNLGADWGLIDSKGVFNADTRYQLLTDDGAHIFIRTSGPAQADGRLHLRLQFETGSAKYWWLNNIIAVGILKAGDGIVWIDAWMLEGN